MTKRVLPPKLSPYHRDRGLTCQEALEPCFHACVDSAERSGWGSEEAAFALLHLSLDHLRLTKSSLTTLELIRGVTVDAGRS